MSNPAISVILPTWDTFDAVRTTVEHLGRQSIADRVELLICAPGAESFEVDPETVAPLHEVRVMEAGDLTATGPARAAAIRAARAEIVAFTEDHSFPEPGWAEALLAAHREPHAAVAPAVRNANPETAVSWADLLLSYGRWVAPGRRGTMSMLPGHNISYKRDVLLEYDDELDRLMESETVLLQDLLDRGHTLLFEPAAVTAHTNFSALRVWLDAQWHVSRVFAATRAEPWSTGRRVAFTAASPAIPLLRLYHTVRFGLRNGTPPGRLLGILPLLALGLTVDFAAQATGTVLGSGRSVARMAAYEFHRNEVNRTGRPPDRLPT